MELKRGSLKASWQRDRLELSRAAVYVADASSLVEVDRIVPERLVVKIFNDLADLLQTERLVFCDNVMEELTRISDDQAAAFLFVKLGRHNCFPRGAAYEDVRAILAQFPLIHPNERRQNAGPFVLAQACELLRIGLDVTLVTEDYRKKPPPQISLAAAADQLAIKRVDMRTMLKDVAIWPRP
jgi:hypothetical protein